MATEGASCSTTADNASHVSVVQFLNANNEERATALCKEWQELLERLGISRSVRETMDDWFVEVYNVGEEVHRIESDNLYHMISDKLTVLYEKFKNRMDQVINSTESRSNIQPQSMTKIARFLLKSDLEQIEQDYSSLEWVKKAIECMEYERKLIQKYSEEPSHGEHTREQDRIIEEQISRCERITKEIDISYNSCCRELEAFIVMCRDVEEKNKVLTDLTVVLKSGIEQNGLSWEKKSQLETTLQQTKDNKNKKGEELSAMLQKLMEQLKAAVEQFRVLTSSVSAEIKDWKLQFQYNYAQIYATPDLDRISPWCEKAGRMLDVLQKLFIHTRNIFTQVGWQWEEHGELYEANMEQMYHDFFQSSLVVVEQDDFVTKKSFPKISVRFLAAEGLGVGGTKIEAHFVFEDYLRPGKGSGLDKELLLKKEKKLLCCQTHFQDKGNNKRGIFSSLQFNDKSFQREGPPNQMVHDKKYRLVFLTTFNGQDYWNKKLTLATTGRLACSFGMMFLSIFRLLTLSLPLVVTTGANQSCQALASIMWQCFSTDVYAVPIPKKDELPWREVAEMLNQKILRLCPQRHLSEEKLKHLKLRLFGGQAVTDDEMVTLKRFCFDKMVSTTFSFWKWFVGSYNLLDKYLLEYWKKGLIEGFVSTEVCTSKFLSKGCKKNGSFILRLSDTCLKDSQSVNNIFGHLISAVASMVEVKGEKKLRINNLRVAGHDLLKNKNLANILKETQDKHQRLVYQHLFTSNISREEAFDMYCQTDPIVDGYQGTHDAFIVDLEHAVSALMLATGKHRPSSSNDSVGIAPAASSRGGKRMKSHNEGKHPMLIHMLSTPQPSPALSVQSPASEERSDQMDDMNMLSGTPQNSPAYSVQSSEAIEEEPRRQNCIPTVVEELSSNEHITNSYVSQMRNNVPQILPTNRVDSQNSVPQGNAVNQVEKSIDSNFQDPLIQQSLSQKTEHANPGSHDYSPVESTLVHPDQTCIAIQGHDSQQSANQLLPNPCQDQDVLRLLQSSPQLIECLQNNSTVFDEDQQMNSESNECILFADQGNFLLPEQDNEILSLLDTENFDTGNFNFSLLGIDD